ncbi:nucleoside triphosphatase YtkD [Alkalihalophilus pseudofirmus]|uniref:Nucleoside triphosphatase YtkD n=2 Tax=Alkalihalophilus TaxID=2893060 RepID=A0AAJ2NPD8_ALKPS|nr:MULTISPECIES: nucleoside triphosphatase YtkD [Alkalihalophilus]ERN52391.1 7,8-dihydro-8-oxoguanine-triphosphatase [Alkalihalophilus marmarensis DSM 21297]MDV2886033.1 nucleoside triphosphatase YtkD [Alkalihalophilus pseudofirmus]OLS35338.1 nucleoside triphosphatase YtkD [Alkalihalophilus pseudofirmus]WEG16327.1 nucleoside triphosphatase YtkD [Alkalihalophilus pseudofirmus]
MRQFTDQNGNTVRLVLNGEEPFSNDPKHVWVICKYRHQWLLTTHQKRGLEFPGGKVEYGETPLEAAHREVLEETGALIHSITWLGQYEVAAEEERIHKNIYFAVISTLQEKDCYYETNGPVCLDALPDTIREDSRFSFVMKDDVLTYCVDYLRKEQLLK